MESANFPLDVQWTDIDAMSSYLDFTYDDINFRGLPDLVRALQAEGIHYVNIIDPGISSTESPGSYPPYDDGMKRGIFMKKFNSTEVITGKVAIKVFYLTLVFTIIFLKGMARANCISRFYES